MDFSTFGDGALLRYRFGIRTADFLVCAKCGVYIGAVMDSPAGVFATVNLNSMTTVVSGLRESTPVFYDSEEKEDKVGRRQSRWTPVTTVI
jgi:hypothetical protein